MTFSNIHLPIAVLVLVMGCIPKPKDSSDNVTQNNTYLIQQQKEDLLNGTVEALCYSGFRSGQHPDRGEGAVNPSPEQILEDLKMLNEQCGTQLIRVYDCGENTQDILEVIRDNELGMKVMLGMWLKAELSNHETCEWLTEPIPDKELKKNKQLNLKEIERGIGLADEFSDIVVAINVGNEALVDWNDHKVATDTIIAYVKRVQSAVDQEVTVADNYLWWAEQGQELAAVVDFISIHVYPIWEEKDIDEGMSFTIENVQQVRDSLPDSRIVISEAGWASVASEFGDRATEEKQLQYYQELMEWSEEMNITTFFFEAFDEDWKGNPTDMMGAEKHWGLYTVDREPKKVIDLFSDPVAQ